MKKLIVNTCTEYVCSLSCSTYEWAINTTTTKPQTRQTPVQPVKNEGKYKRELRHVYSFLGRR